MFLAGGRGKSILSERGPQFFVEARAEHVIGTKQRVQVIVLYCANWTCSCRVLLYIPKVISLSGWLLRDDASSFQYYFSKPSFQCFNGIEQPCRVPYLGIRAHFDYDVVRKQICHHWLDPDPH